MELLPCKLTPSLNNASFGVRQMHFRRNALSIVHGFCVDFNATADNCLYSILDGAAHFLRFQTC